MEGAKTVIFWDLPTLSGCSKAILSLLHIRVNSLTISVKRSGPGLPKVHPSQSPLMEKAAMQTEEEMLQAEIEFWRYMIKCRRGTLSEQATERMLRACELAEWRLLLMDSSKDRTETWQ
jgi:hypothetical protein